MLLRVRAPCQQSVTAANLQAGPCPCPAVLPCAMPGRRGLPLPPSSSDDDSESQSESEEESSQQGSQGGGAAQQEPTTAGQQQPPGGAPAQPRCECLEQLPGALAGFCTTR
jgi:hypothetical protein